MSHAANTTPSQELTIRIELHNSPGSFARLAQVIAQEGGSLGSVDIVATGRESIVRDVSIFVHNNEHRDELVERVRRSAGVNLVNVTDHAMDIHAGGKLQIDPRFKLTNRRSISEAYLPGALAPAAVIRDQPEQAHRYTIKRNSVALISDGSKIARLGEGGAAAALPVIEGKSMIFRQFANVDAYPLAIDEHDPERLAEIVRAVSPGFGAIVLEEMDGALATSIICSLKDRLAIPVYHDLYDSWAIVVVAFLINAARAAGVELASLETRFVGRSPSIGTLRALVAAAGIEPVEREDARVTIGVACTEEEIAEIESRVSKNSIVALLERGLAARHFGGVWEKAGTFGSTRVELPNQIDPILASPGLMRGVLGVLATEINTEMKLAAARALAETIHDGELSEDHLLPSVFNGDIVKNISKGVAAAALKSGVGRRKRHRIGQ